MAGSVKPNVSVFRSNHHQLVRVWKHPTSRVSRVERCKKHPSVAVGTPTAAQNRGDSISLNILSVKHLTKHLQSPHLAKSSSYRGDCGRVSSVWPHRIEGQDGDHVFTREEDVEVHRHIQRRGSGVGVQLDDRVCIPRGKRQPQCQPVHRGQAAYMQRMVQLPEVHPRTERPTKRSLQAQNPDAKSRGTRDSAVRLRHVEPPRVPLRHAAPSSLPVLDSLHWLAKAQSRRPPDFLSGHASQDRK